MTHYLNLYTKVPPLSELNVSEEEYISVVEKNKTLVKGIEDLLRNTLFTYGTGESKMWLVDSLSHLDVCTCTSDEIFKQPSSGQYTNEERKILPNHFLFNEKFSSYV
eukprot:TRINITY_DN20533_c0_g1_i1.p1 TRINITY_DN20533_c0_g1~~TRINITY_DN20533_c0_g1_i1.p1  ORF type:complete len:123 (-),score=25.59 TRINITY_DN20533_c0_g1_i1:116-436(-)